MKIRFLNKDGCIDRAEAQFSSMEILLVMAALRDMTENGSRDMDDRRDAQEMLLYMRERLSEDFKDGAR